jgi:hypothetical protein
MNTILAVFGWLVIVVAFGWWLVAYGLIVLNSGGRFNMGGAPNSYFTRIVVFLLGILNILAGIQIAKIAPFTITF